MNHEFVECMNGFQLFAMIETLERAQYYLFLAELGNFFYILQNKKEKISEIINGLGSS